MGHPDLTSAWLQRAREAHAERGHRDWVVDESVAAWMSHLQECQDCLRWAGGAVATEEVPSLPQSCHFLRSRRELVTRAMSRLRRAAAGAIGDSFVDPSMVALSHRWSCGTCREWFSSSGGRAPYEGVAPHCHRGCVAVGLALAAPPLQWLSRGEQDQSRVPRRYRRRLRSAFAPDAPPLGFAHPPSLRPQAAGEVGVGVALAQCEALVESGKARRLVELDMPKSPVLTAAMLGGAGVPKGTFVHSTRVAYGTTYRVEANGSVVALADAPTETLTSPHVLRRETDLGSKPRLVQGVHALLNTWVRPPAFRFASVTDWFRSLPEGVRLASLDESAAFYALYVREADQRRLCFCAADHARGKLVVYQPRMPGFGANVTVCLYATVKAVIVEALNRHIAAWAAASPDIHVGTPEPVTTYVDDMAMAADAGCSEAIFALCGDTLRAHGLQVNVAKSSPPAGSLTHVGLRLDATRGRVTLPATKLAELRRLALAMGSATGTLKCWAGACGKLRSSAPGLGPRLAPVMYGAWMLLRAPGRQVGR